MTDAKFRAPDDGGGAEALGAGMQRLGRAASSFAEAWSECDAMRDEAKTRKADNALVESWQTLSEPYFGSSGEAAVKAGPAARQSLDEEISRQRATLDNDRQRGMFDQVAKLRRDEWLSRIGQHEESAVADFDETESQRRQALAVGSMADAAAKDYGPGVVANEQVLFGEVDGRSRRRGLDEAGAHQARVKALAAARAKVVEQLADVDPGKAQAWLDAHRADIGDPAVLQRLDRMLRPFVEEQQAERIAGEIRAGTSGLDAQIAGIDGLDLPPASAARVKERLQQHATADESATRNLQKEAADKAWALALNPASISLRAIPPSIYGALAPEEQGAVRAAIAANARMEDPAPDPGLYLALSDKAALATLTIDDVRHAWGKLPRKDWDRIASRQRDVAEHGFSSDDRTFDDPIAGPTSGGSASLSPLRLADASDAIPMGAVIGGQAFTVYPPGMASSTAVPIDQWSTRGTDTSERKAWDAKVAENPEASHAEIVKMINDEALASLEQQANSAPPTQDSSAPAVLSAPPIAAHIDPDGLIASAASRPTSESDPEAQPGVRRGPGLDVMGQPLHGKSNFDAGHQLGNILRDSPNVPLVTTVKRILQLGAYRVPDERQRNEAMRDPYRGMTPEAARLAESLDRLEGGTISGISVGVSRALGADRRTEDLVHGLGTAADDMWLAHGGAKGAEGTRFLREPRILESGNPPRLPERALPVLKTSPPVLTRLAELTRQKNPFAVEPVQSRSLVPSATTSLGKWGEIRLANFLGGRGIKPSTALKTPLGPRYADRIIDDILYESKAGLNVRSTASIKRQMAKDAYLLRSGKISGVEWHFWRGAAPELIEDLRRAGINPIIH